jgi:DNA ligase D-like protein (predicted 3'-phosphoesterase)
MKSHKKFQESLFVVQLHDARHLHYDFRLEIAGVLVSWAVPKGPSCVLHEKRLAVRTKDHPLEYALFEGVIPHGSYGAGTVMVWDYGTYSNKKEDVGLTMSDCLYDGKIEVVLHGQKLKGTFALVAAKSIDNPSAWLLLKTDHSCVMENSQTTRLQKSALTGRSLEEIKKASTKI